ncbi:hemerythrin domain-containing protein [Jiangella asiatica]|nr:hemerythrin domain-containing protein [Jiangella asiatica]
MPEQPHDNPFADPDRVRAVGEHLLRVHGDLRRELATALSGVDDVIARLATEPAGPGEAAQGRSLAQHCLTVCDALEQHHSGEDGALGPLERLFPQLGPAVERIRAEHRTVAADLARVRELAASLDDDGVDAERVRDELATLTAGIERHFAYEERELLPAMGVTVP